MKQLNKNSENTLDTRDIHIDNAGDSNDNVNDNMTTSDKQNVTPIKNEHSVTTTYEYYVVQV